MTTAIEVIERVLSSDVLTPGLMIVPPTGANEAMISECEVSVGRVFSGAHRRLLNRWNGLDLEVIRVFGCAPDDGEIVDLASAQIRVDAVAGAVTFASDPAGFAYIEDTKGSIYSVDSDGGAIQCLASDLDAFFGRVVFGPEAATFGGDHWQEELEAAGLLE